jgi:hypothetical protein
MMNCFLQPIRTLDEDPLRTEHEYTSARDEPMTNPNPEPVLTLRNAAQQKKR